MSGYESSHFVACETRQLLKLYYDLALRIERPFSFPWDVSRLSETCGFGASCIHIYIESSMSPVLYSLRIRS